MIQSYSRAAVLTAAMAVVVRTPRPADVAFHTAGQELPRKPSDNPLPPTRLAQPSIPQGLRSRIPNSGLARSL